MRQQTAHQVSHEEHSMVTKGRKRYYENLAEDRAKGQESETEGGRRFMREVIEPVAIGIEEWKASDPRNEIRLFGNLKQYQVILL